MNSINLIGRSGRDIEKRQAGESQIYSGSIALNRGKDQDPDWIKIEAWNKTGELLQKFATKGSQVGVTGVLKIEKWTDNAGNKRETPVVVVNNVSPIFSNKPEAGSSTASGASRSGGSAGAAKRPQNNDEIPF